MRKCPICKNEVVGRTDKRFCSVACKSSYHRQLRTATSRAAFEIDKILHRNRSILLELMGKHKVQIKVPSVVLYQKGFKHKYHTHITQNRQGKSYYYVYDFAWMPFSNDEVLIVRKA